MNKDKWHVDKVRRYTSENEAITYNRRKQNLENNTSKIKRIKHISKTWKEQKYTDIKRKRHDGETKMISTTCNMHHGRDTM